MLRSVLSGDQEIVFTVQRSARRRTVSLQVTPAGDVMVLAPSFTWNFFIDRMVRRHADWVIQKLAYWKEQTARHPPRPQILDSSREAFGLKTRERLAAVLDSYADRLGVRPRSVQVSNQRRRWGSCTVRGDLRFSWRMAELPPEIFDYIVVHELAHLKEMNHGPRFWALVSAVFPDHKTHRRWLRRDGPR